MKQIIIYQEKTAPILIEDNDESNIEEFTAKLSTLLESNNVSLLHTSQGSIVLRPNKITSIVVNEIKSTDVKQSEVEKPKEESEDIITD